MSEILQKISGKRIILCLPGNQFSANFTLNLIRFNNELIKHGIEVMISQAYSPEIHQLRSSIAGGSSEFGLYQRPFTSQFLEEDHYDYLMWIDSDIIFSLSDFEGLLEMDKDIASGWYRMSNGLPVVGNFIKRKLRFSKKNFPLPLYDKDTIYSCSNNMEVETATEPFVVDWAGMGWMLMKRGVMEELMFPWFAPKIVRYNLPEAYEVLSEDLSFALSLKDAGFDIWVHPKIKVGHEKIRVI